MSEVLKKIQDEIAAFMKKKEELVEELRKDFPKMLQPFFDRCPLLKKFSWTQYTPYFNDGDECTFGVNIHMDDYYINEDVEGAVAFFIPRYYREDKDVLTRFPEGNMEYSKIMDELETLLNTIPDDFYRDLFGDHVQVTIHSTGEVDVEDYSHD